MGLHPLEARQWQPDLAEKIAQLAASDTRVVAIGETGLDFYKSDPADIERQQASFRAHIAIAQEQDLALIVHCREAAAATYEILREAIRLHLAGAAHRSRLCCCHGLDSAALAVVLAQEILYLCAIAHLL